jgi:YVTN family beta-propeller protein
VVVRDTVEAITEAKTAVERVKFKEEVKAAREAVEVEKEARRVAEENAEEARRIAEEKVGAAEEAVEAEKEARKVAEAKAGAAEEARRVAEVRAAIKKARARKAKEEARAAEEAVEAEKEARRVAEAKAEARAIKVEEEVIQVAARKQAMVAYVVNRDSSDISVIETATHKVLATIPVGGIALSTLSWHSLLNRENIELVNQQMILKVTETGLWLAPTHLRIQTRKPKLQKKIGTQR